MARNNHPEKTIEQILTISNNLFLTKGYDKTTIQDIIDELKLSKGAIYHHFKSKEEILNMILKDYTVQLNKQFYNLIQNTDGNNAREKLEKITKAMFENIQKNDVSRFSRMQIRNSQYILAEMRNTFDVAAKDFSKLFVEGMEDGSITTAYPSECAEVFLLLLNIWINPILFQRDIDQTKQRLYALQGIMKLLGADIISNEMIEKCIQAYLAMNAFEGE